MNRKPWTVMVGWIGILFMSIAAVILGTQATIGIIWLIQNLHGTLAWMALGVFTGLVGLFLLDVSI